MLLGEFQARVGLYSETLHQKKKTKKKEERKGKRQKLKKSI
jgi:hypothetical protein